MIQENPEQLGYWFDPDEDVVWEECANCQGVGAVQFFPEPQPCLTCWETGLVPDGCSE